jgi:hypothetical protein
MWIELAPGGLLNLDRTVGVRFARADDRDLTAAVETVGGDWPGVTRVARRCPCGKRCRRCACMRSAKSCGQGAAGMTQNARSAPGEGRAKWKRNTPGKQHTLPRVLRLAGMLLATEKCCSFRGGLTPQIVAAFTRGTESDWRCGPRPPPMPVALPSPARESTGPTATCHPACQPRRPGKAAGQATSSGRPRASVRQTPWLVLPNSSELHRWGIRKFRFFLGFIDVDW